MLTTLICTLILAQNQTEPPKPPTEKPAELVTKMLAHYAGAKSMQGTITLTQTYSGKTATIDTQLAYEKPGLLYIRQDARMSNGLTALVVSNGNFFKYTIPVETGGKPGQMLFESLRDGNKIMDYTGVYTAGSKSLIDRSQPLDIVIAKREDLVLVNQTWATLEWGEPTKFGEQVAWLVTGDWREEERARPVGKFGMWITEAGDLLRYEIKEVLKLDAKSPAMTMTSTWAVQMQVDAKPNPELFRLPN